MRNLFSLLLFALIISTSAFANKATISSENLTQKVWKSEVSDDVTIYYDFQEPTAVDIITKNANGKLVWSTAFWDMTQNERGTYLTIKQKLNGDPVTFKLEGDGEQLVLSNDKLKTTLASISIKDNSYSLVKADLVGKWKSPFYDTKTKDVANTDTRVRHMWKQGFEFNEDGTFVRQQQEGKKAERESGVWTLSKDGNFIKLHFANNGNVENIYKREVLNIDQFRNDWMRVNTESADKDLEISAYDLHKQS